MGAYAYCRHKDCDAPLKKPTAQEAFGYGGWTCVMGHKNDVSEYMSVGDYLCELEERIEALEDRLKYDGG